MSTDRCDYLQVRNDITASIVDSDDDSGVLHCLRPANHTGPHLVQRGEFQGQALIAWQEDPCPIGECEFCDSEDSTDWCLVYAEVDFEIALRMKDDVNYDPWKEE